jgi:hypothetical protein
MSVIVVVMTAPALFSASTKMLAPPTLPRLRLAVRVPAWLRLVLLLRHPSRTLAKLTASQTRTTTKTASSVP